MVGLAHLLANTKCIYLHKRIYSNRSHMCNHKRNHSTCDRGWETSFLGKCSRSCNIDIDHLYKRMAMYRCASRASVRKKVRNVCDDFFKNG